MLTALESSSIDHLCDRTNGAGDAEDSAADVTTGWESRRAQYITQRECQARSEIKKTLPDRFQCMKYSASECYKSRHCEWGAQRERHCGVDEERLILDVVGEDHVDHPLVQFLVTSNACREKGQQACVADPSCEWGHPVCDIKEALVYHQVFYHPQMLVLLQILQANAYCHSLHESRQMCASPICRMEYGICRFNHTMGKDLIKFEFDDMVRVVCQSHSPSRKPRAVTGAEDEGSTTQAPPECNSPCRVSETGECEPPVKVPHNMREANITRSDWHIFGLLLQFDASVFLTERICNHYDRDQDRCLTSEETCGEHHKPEPPPVDHSNVKDLSELSHGKSGGIGSDGVLGQIIQAAKTGEVNKRLDDYLQSHPEALAEIGAKMREGFENFAKKPAEPRDEFEEEEFVHGERDDDDDVRTWPVLITAGAMIVCTLSTGLACGTLCSGMVGGGSAGRREVRLLQADEPSADYDGALNNEGSASGAVLSC